MALSLKELQIKHKEYSEKHEILQNALGINEKKRELSEVEKKLEDPALWSDTEKTGELNKKKRLLENSLELFNSFDTKFDELTILCELMSEGENAEDEAETISDSIEELIRKLEFQKMLGGKMDANNAIVYINSGAGGRESQDWAVMLMRMYTRWAERHKFEIEIIDKVTGDDAAAIKSVTMIISGDYAYGYLKAENGVHRLVRISPFDANKRRHTSFASVFITPEIDDSIDIEIEEKDLKIDTYRASGAGGQHVNTTDSAIRITHIPSGIIVTCQKERSQHKNKATAMKILKSKLYEMELEKKNENIVEQEKGKMGINFGSQIRSYVLHPYKMVKDHRTDFEKGNAEAVLDGEDILDEFMEAYLLSGE